MLITVGLTFFFYFIINLSIYKSVTLLHNILNHFSCICIINCKVYFDLFILMFFLLSVYSVHFVGASRLGMMLG